MNIYQDGRKTSQNVYRMAIDSKLIHKIEADGAVVGDLEESVQEHGGFLLHNGIAALPAHLKNLLETGRLEMNPKFAMLMAGLTNGALGDYNLVYQGHVYRVEIREKKPGKNHSPEIPTTTVTSFRLLR